MMHGKKARIVGDEVPNINSSKDHTLTLRLIQHYIMNMHVILIVSVFIGTEEVVNSGGLNSQQERFSMVKN